jgi:hypothetical protein
MRTIADGHIQVEVGDTSGVVGSVRKAEPGRRVPAHQFRMHGAVMESKGHETTTFSSCSSSSSILHGQCDETTPRDTLKDCARDGTDSVANIGHNVLSEPIACNSHNMSRCNGAYVHQLGARDVAHGMPQAESLVSERLRHKYQFFPPDDRGVTSNGSVAGSLASELSARRSRRRAPRRRAYKHSSRDFLNPKRPVQAGCSETKPDGEIVPGVPVLV